jgi:DNA-binding transcriptional regulator YiaG
VQKGYPQELKTVGDHIRKRRRDLKLFQKDVAKIIRVDKVTIQNWEVNSVEPSFKHIPKIREFLGYSPCDETPAKILAQKILAFRKFHGLSQKNLAHSLGISPDTLADWESGKTKQPTKKLLKKLAFFFKTYSSAPKPEDLDI